MGYEEAPATRMLASQCAVCGRPLVDAVSVDAGMGPDCRDKHGFNDEAVSEDGRKAANAAVYQIALLRSQGALTGTVLASAVGRIKSAGLHKLAAVLVDRLTAVKVGEDGGRLTVVTPYDAGAVEAFRRVNGRRWDAAKKLNTFPRESAQAVYAVMVRFYQGAIGAGPKGLFTVGGEV
jgi:hypothetical protein